MQIPNTLIIPHIILSWMYTLNNQKRRIQIDEATNSSSLLDWLEIGWKMDDKDMRQTSTYIVAHAHIDKRELLPFSAIV